MLTRTALTLALLAATAAIAEETVPAAPVKSAAKPPAKVAAPACTGKLSGAMTGSFTCRARIVSRGPVKTRIELSPLKLPQGVSVFRGEMEVAALHPKDDPNGPAQLDLAKVHLTSKGHVTYGATLPKDRKGEVVLQVVETPAAERAQGKEHEVPAVKGGTLKAKLLADAPSAGAVTLEVKF